MELGAYYVLFQISLEVNSLGCDVLFVSLF